MDKKKIPTGVGISVIIIIAFSVGIFIEQYNKNQSKLEGQNTKQDQIREQKNSKQQEISQPIMPSLKDEANKSPELLVKDFYTWYIGNINYYFYQTSQLHETPININELIKSSPFISSNYIQNIAKRKGMYNAVLCTNDDEFSIVKEYGKSQINGDTAKVNISRGSTRNEESTKIQILLKREGQWKIDDIICDFQIK